MTDREASPRIRLPGGGVLAGLACGCVGGTVLAFVYSQIAVWIPVFYLPVPFVFGWGIGAACGLGSRLGGRLGAWPGRILGGISGVVAMYAAWVFWLLALSRYETLMVNPAAMRVVIGELAKDGVWSMGGSTPKGGTLLCIWFLEFFVVCLTSWLCAGMYCQERERERKDDAERVF